MVYPRGLSEIPPAGKKTHTYMNHLFLFTFLLISPSDLCQMRSQLLTLFKVPRDHCGANIGVLCGNESRQYDIVVTFNKIGVTYSTRQKKNLVRGGRLSVVVSCSIYRNRVGSGGFVVDYDSCVEIIV